MSGRTYVFAGGGTGGHLFPGIAVAECLLERQPETRVMFVGSDRAIERDILAATPFEHRVLPAVSLAVARRHPLRFTTNAWQSCRAASVLMTELRADAVIGCGGFASAAPVLAARRQGVPFLLLEQNAIPGRATRWLSRLGGTVCLTYAQTESLLPKSAKRVLTGNPVRDEIASLVSCPLKPSNLQSGTLLVLGGSQGARRINDLMMSVAVEHRELLNGWRVVHQTGPTDEQQVRATYASHQIDAQVSAFFADSASLYRQADVVVSRAGGTTLSELACAGLPAVLFPYPHAVGDHQWHNAEVFHAAGAALIGDESRAVDQFTDQLASLLKDGNLRQQMSAAMSAFARPEAAINVVKILEAFPPAH